MLYGINRLVRLVDHCAGNGFRRASNVLLPEAFIQPGVDFSETVDLSLNCIFLIQVVLLQLFTVGYYPRLVGASKY